MFPVFFFVMVTLAAFSSSAYASISDDGGSLPEILTIKQRAEFENRLSSCAVGDSSLGNFTCADWEFMVSSRGENKVDDVLYCMNYDKFISPATAMQARLPENDTYFLVSNILARLTFDKVVELDQEQQSLEVDFTIELNWQDPRLEFPKRCQSEEDDDSLVAYILEKDFWIRIWEPTLYLEDLFDMETRDSFKQASIKFILLVNGEVNLIASYSARVGCDLNFRYFPFDRQECPFKMYLDMEDGLTFSWFDGEEPLSLTDKSKLNLPEWDVSLEVLPEFKVYDKRMRGTSDGLGAKLDFSRVYTVHISHTFFPSFMISLTSIFSLFVPAHLVPGRMALCVTSLLTMISLFNASRVAWPKTSFMKASDIWTIGCYTTVFATVAEYCLVLFLVERAKWQERVEERVGWLCFRGRKKIGDDQRRRSGWDSSEGKQLGDLKKEEILAHRLEEISRIAVPVFYFLFNLIFWCLAVMP